MTKIDHEVGYNLKSTMLFKDNYLNQLSAENILMIYKKRGIM